MLKSPLLAGVEAAVEDGRLLSAIAQLPRALEANHTLAWYRLPKSVLQKAQQLVHLLVALRSPESGWPAHLPYSVEQLTPYVSEEAYELLEAVRQLALSRQGTLNIATAEHLNLVDWQLRQMTLTALRTQLLWEVASSGHWVMQLMRGLRVTIADRPETLFLVVRLRTESDSVALNAPGVARPLDDETQVQIDSGELFHGTVSTAQLLEQIAAQLQTNPVLRNFLGRQAVNLLQPGQPWHQTFLQITLHLVVQAAVPEIIDTPPADSSFLLPDTLDQFLLAAGNDDELSGSELNGTDARLDTSQAEDLEILTADDLALALTGSPASLTPTPQPARQNGSRQNGNGHRPGAMPPADAPAGLVPAWITVTDDRWIGSLSEMIARQLLLTGLPLSRLVETLGKSKDPENWLPVVIETACSAASRVSADSGLFQQNFFQQAVYLEDLLPQLLWYVHRSAAAIATLVDGIPAQFLAPGGDWQTGQLRLLTTLQLRTRYRKMMVDLASATLLPCPVQRLHREGVVQSQALSLTHAPHTVAQLETRLYRLLRQATPELDWLLRGTTLEMHLLEASNEPERQAGAMQLGLGLQFEPESTTLAGEVV